VAVTPVVVLPVSAGTGGTVGAVTAPLPPAAVVDEPAAVVADPAAVVADAAAVVVGAAVFLLLLHAPASIAIAVAIAATVKVVRLTLSPPASSRIVDVAPPPVAGYLQHSSP